MTGAGARIGKAIAADLAAAGWTVAVHFGTSQDAAAQTVEEITSSGGTAALFQADLSAEVETSGLVARVSDDLGPVTCLINNASVFDEDTLPTVTKDSWDAHMSVNLRAPFVLSQKMAAQLEDATPANIINLLDQRVHNLTPFFTSYTVSKAALWTLTQTMAQALAPRIRVNGIGPGPTLPSSRQTDEQFRRQIGNTPLQRQIDVAEICAAVRFILASPSMTGQMISLDSGQHLGWAQPGTDPRPME